jgi:CRP-like cAMP-binding protein
LDEAEVLRGLPLFAGLGEGDLVRVAARVQRRLLARGEVLCRRGDEGRELYVVVSGAVEVRHGDGLLHLAGPARPRVLVLTERLSGVSVTGARILAVDPRLLALHRPEWP